MPRLTLLCRLLLGIFSILDLDSGICQIIFHLVEGKSYFVAFLDFEVKAKRTLPVNKNEKVIKLGSSKSWLRAKSSNLSSSNKTLRLFISFLQI